MESISTLQIQDSNVLEIIKQKRENILNKFRDGGLKIFVHNWGDYYYSRLSLEERSIFRRKDQFLIYFENEMKDYIDFIEKDHNEFNWNEIDKIKMIENKYYQMIYLSSFDPLKKDNHNDFESKEKQISKLTINQLISIFRKNNNQ